MLLQELVVVVVMSSHGCKEGNRGGQSTELSRWVLGEDDVEKLEKPISDCGASVRAVMS